jgi:hypothetical protein
VAVNQSHIRKSSSS